MSNEVKYFTPKEAARTLPLVRKIVEDILKEGKAVRDMIASRGVEYRTEPPVLKKIELVRKYLEELSSIGCIYKDWNFTFGLIDFPSVIDDEEVYLCWRSDESDVLFYHGIEDGYAGRKPIPDIYFI